MFSSAVLDLRNEPSWNPSRVSSDAFAWPDGHPEIRLAELVVALAANSVADVGSPVITPSSIDRATGGVRRRSRAYQGAAFQVGSDLEPGDLLVPPSTTGPVLLLSGRHAGALVSARFIALRPGNPDEALWLWGLLSSETGRQFRSTLSQGAMMLRLDPLLLLNAGVPMSLSQSRRHLLEELRLLQASTLGREEEPNETWWHKADLRVTEWRMALATPDPDPLGVGDPFEALCKEIVAGRPTRPVAVEVEAPGHLPVVDILALSGNPPRRWVSAEQERVVVAQPGDLLLARVGTIPHATVIDHLAVADHQVVVCRLRDPALGASLACFLNSQRGYGLRQVLSTGTAIPTISLRDLRRLPIDPSALQTAPDADLPVSDLSERLELLLWMN